MITGSPACVEPASITQSADPEKAGTRLARKLQICGRSVAVNGADAPVAYSLPLWFACTIAPISNVSGGLPNLDITRPSLVALWPRVIGHTVELAGTEAIPIETTSSTPIGIVSGAVSE